MLLVKERPLSIIHDIYLLGQMYEVWNEESSTLDVSEAQSERRALEGRALT